MKRLVMAFSGPSNSGKTTIIQKIGAKFIADGLKVAIIKHDPKDKASFDTPGKDSYKFQQIGAEVVVASPNKTTFFSQESKSLEDIIKIFGDFDMLLIEGFKELDLPRISIFKDEIDSEYLSFSNAIASYKESDYDILNFNLDDVDTICKWILENAVKV